MHYNKEKNKQKVTLQQKISFPIYNYNNKILYSITIFKSKDNILYNIIIQIQKQIRLHILI